MARGAFPDSHPQHLGMPGMHGTVAAVGALQKADLLVALGARFDDRVTGQLATSPRARRSSTPTSTRPRSARTARADVPIVGDAREVHRRADRRRRAPSSGRHRRRPRPRGGRSSTTCARRYPLGYDWPADGSLSPQYVIERLGKIAGPDAIYAAGVGQHQMWAAQFISLREAAAPGSTPAAWARWATRCRRRWAPRSAARTPSVWAIDGDGCFQMTNQELATCAHRGHPDQGRHHQQRQPRHGPAVADPVLRRALLPDRPRHAQAPHPGLRDAGRGAGLRRAALRDRARTSTATIEAGDGDQRPPGGRSTSWSARTRRSGRWSPPAPATTRSWSPAASGRCSTTTSCADRRDRRRRRGVPEPMMQQHTLSVLVENKPGVLARVVGAVLPARLQHRLAGGRADRAPRGLPDDDRRRRRGLPARAGHQAAQQAGQRAQDRRAGAGAVGAARAAAGQGARRPRGAQRRCSRPSSCSGPRSSTSRRTR